ncbi:hypothetical protein N9Q58_02600 [Polaribacter sp.]|nr:hypothetical protein [Polaribacter sp.]
MLFLVTISSLGQERTFLTETEFNNILVDGVKWIDIDETLGKVDGMKNLFGSSINYQIGIEPDPSIGFWDKGFYFDFQEGGDGEYELFHFSIDDNLSSITIKGVTVTIGDSIHNLSGININSYQDGSSGVIFVENGSGSDGLFIKYNPSTFKITEIEYNLFD